MLDGVLISRDEDFRRQVVELLRRSEGQARLMLDLPNAADELPREALGRVLGTHPQVVFLDLGETGTTGVRVCFWSSAGNSSSSKACSTAPMWRTAESPRNGIEPCAIVPLVSISAHQTPRWPRQIRSLFSGSGMMTWSTRGLEK